MVAPQDLQAVLIRVGPPLGMRGVVKRKRFFKCVRDGLQASCQRAMRDWLVTV